MSDFSKLLEKKKKDGKGLSDNEKEAKLGVLKHLHDMASGAMGEGLKGLKKVTVASDSKEGLSHGLDKAKEILKDAPGHESEQSDDESSPLDQGADEVEEEALDHEGPEGHHDLPMESDEEQKMGEHDDMSEEELDAKLAELMAKKKALQGKK